ncbi:MAG TPA: signal protein PDZ [Gammaproteobacteria bacterium]|nr:signal protein PDZ [Gammaproteobacteria bacterium]|tara:strand:- start:836 stop:1813 length:978 start_codon:yes stop_codon:yes gene_type:complete
MSDKIEQQIQISQELRPTQASLTYDLETALESIVSVRARIPDDAFTASFLGTDRSGHGVRILDTGLVVTIGYVIAEAEEIWLIGANGQAVTGHVVGYDYETGFGLVQPLAQMDLPTLDLGDSDIISTGDKVVVAGCGGVTQSLDATVIAKREFAGYWEYVLDEAIFTSPPHPDWGGAALISANGQLVGIGSLYVENVAPKIAAGNMIVPINILKPIMEEMLDYGTTLKAPRPWLGLFVTETPENLVVAGVLDGGPAEKADVRTGDAVIGVAGERTRDLADFFRRIWAQGEAGSEIPITIYRDGDTFDVHISSVDRRAQFKSPELH